MSNLSDTTRNLATECDFVAENAEAFALGALDTAENQRILLHLLDHAECQVLIDQAVRTTQYLAFSMPLEPAPDSSIKRALMQRISATGQDAAPATRTVVFEPDPPESATYQSERPWWQYLSGALAAPLAVALVVVSLWAYQMNNELDDMKGEEQSTVLQVLSMQSMGSSNAGGSLGMSDQTSAVFMGWALDPETDHELWCEKKNGSKVKVTELNVDSTGNTMQTVEFPDPIDEYKKIYVSGRNEAEEDWMELELVMQNESDESDTTTPSSPAA